MDNEEFNFIVTTIVKGKKQNRIVKAENSLSARFKVYHQLMAADKKGNFTIIDVKQKGEKQ